MNYILSLSRFGLRCTQVSVACLMMTACSHHGTQPDPAPFPGPVVQARPMTFDPRGSDAGDITGLTTVHFAYDDADLSNNSKSEIQQNAKWLNQHPGTDLTIEGHCDARGSIEYNLALGDRRAQSVKNYMASLGIDGNRLKTISYGKERPLVAGDTESAYAQNRRANFVPMTTTPARQAAR